LKKLLLLIVLLGLALAGAVAFWSTQPLIELAEGAQPVEFSIQPGSSVRQIGEQIAAAGIPVYPLLFELLARASGKGDRLKAGDYELDPGVTPRKLVDKLARGQFAQKSLAVIEGWTFRQMRAAVAANPALRHETVKLSDAELLAQITPDFKIAEGLFFPDTYLFAKGASDLQIYRKAHALLMQRLNDHWEARDPSVPYKTPYQALVMASIVEKETGRKAERSTIAGVFVNRLRLGMLLQTDPTVIYGMGDRYTGKITKRDLQTDTPYNTYTRAGLPPSPIALPGAAALAAALRPAKTEALYFVSRGDGSSQFSDNLTDHNRAVNKFQR
jgi:UPF0755 protein